MDLRKEIRRVTRKAILSVCRIFFGRTQSNNYVYIALLFGAQILFRTGYI
jgi:hypothetical protein